MDIGIRKAFKRIVVYLMLIIIPILAVDYYVDAYASFRLTYNKIAEIAMESNYCVGNDISLSERKAKWSIMNHMAAAEYMILGSSRSMLFSKENLALDSFFNMGVSGGSWVYDYLAEIYILYYNDKLPDYMLIELSPCIFNRYSGGGDGKEWGNSTEYMRRVMMGENIHYDDSELLGVQVKDIISPAYFKYNWEQLIHHRRTYVEKNMFADNEQLETWHIDGSFSYSRMFQQKNDIETILREINSDCESKSIYGCSNFKGIDQSLCEEFCKLLDFLKDKGVKVSFYLPPYAEPMYDYICAEDDYAAILEVEKWALQYGAENGIQVYGSYDPTNSNLKLADFYDGYHIRDYKVRDTLWVRIDGLPCEWSK